MISCWMINEEISKEKSLFLLRVCIHIRVEERNRERERLPRRLLFCALQDASHTKWRQWKRIDDNKYTVYPFMGQSAFYCETTAHSNISMVRLCRCHHLRRRYHCHCCCILSQFVVCIVLCYKEMRSANVFACARSFADTSRTWKEINYGYFSFSCFSTVILVYLTLFFSLWKPCFLVI